MKLDLARTQFLITKGAFTTTVKPYRRRRATMMFDKNDQPVRLMTWKEWQKFNSDWPEEVKAERLSLRNVWVLGEIEAR